MILYPKQALKEFFEQYVEAKNNLIVIDFNGFQENYFDNSEDNDEYEDLIPLGVQFPTLSLYNQTITLNKH